MSHKGIRRISRRDLLQTAAAATLAGAMPRRAFAQEQTMQLELEYLRELYSVVADDPRCRRTITLLGHVKVGRLFGSGGDAMSLAGLLDPFKVPDADPMRDEARSRINMLKDTLNDIRRPLTARRLFTDSPSQWDEDEAKVNAIGEALEYCNTYFVVTPYSILDDDGSRRNQIRDLLDGWSMRDTEGTDFSAPGILYYWADSTLEEAFFTRIGDGDNDDYLWKYHLRKQSARLGITNVYGLTARYQTGDVRAEGNNECAAWDGMQWRCVEMSNHKCSLDEDGNPIEGQCDYCPPS